MMAKKRFIGRIIDTRVDRWMSWDYISSTTGRIKNTLSDITTPEEAKYSETFEEAMLRQNLTEADIAKRKKEFKRLFYFFTFIGIAVIFYAAYMAYTKHFSACFISFCLALFAFSQAFKWHFWLFQLRNRKLGCTLSEWLNGKVIDDLEIKALDTTSSSAKLSNQKTSEEKPKIKKGAS